MAFTPAFPSPPRTKNSFWLRLLRGWSSWISGLPERSYAMKMGHFRILGLDFYMVNDPPWVKKILVDEYATFPKHQLMHEILKPLLGESIFTTNGPVWERQRRLVDIAFEKANLKLVFPLMQGAVFEMIKRLDQVADGRSHEVDAEATFVTADVMFRAILSERLSGADAQAIYRAFLVFQHHTHRYLIFRVYKVPMYFTPKICASSAGKIRKIIADIIQRRYALRESQPNEMPGDMLGALMEARDPVVGDSFEYGEMVDQICMLFLAGHETSASAMGWALYLLSHSPDLQEEMLAEIEQVVGEREIEYGDTNKFKSTFDLFREALRLYPPVACFLRETTQETSLRDRSAKKGSLVMVSPWLIQRHRALWERPDEFDPSRFSTPEGKESLKCAYLPFSKGPRVCPGQTFAIQEAVLILASIVRRFRVEPDASHTPRPVGRITLRSGNGIRVRFFRREPGSSTTRKENPLPNESKCPFS